jgi:hypothetical protein
MRPEARRRADAGAVLVSCALAFAATAVFQLGIAAV